MKLTWIGHACFKLEEQEYSIIFDPYKDGVVPGLKDVNESANLVLCSHDHRDHYGIETVDLIDGGTNPFEVIKIATYHDDKEGSLRGNNVIHILQNEDLKIVHFGDLGCELTEQQMQKLQGIDVAMIPIGGFYTIDAPTAKKIIDQIQPKVVIPMHYRGDDFGYDVIGTVAEFTKLCEKNVEYVNGSSLDIMPGMKEGTVVLKPARQ